ncbi:biopolymer transporter ExbD [Oceanicoccus sp. KOV_DT_Chl]|uniref:ExbD/TolR family protein n=1 Tax=Oceanicoccus sp. KOV_DT_Chl TaxID=1904639 RepID=UPI000C7D6115|nr:biopolymer transporter ExbD [Oceanicoccus sp. KOV_DT_Chl]
MSALTRRSVAEKSAEIDLTPMLDVVFIMLIFFIVTASFIREASISLERPSLNPLPPSTEPKNIVVNLKADNQIFLDNRRIDHRSLRAYFERHRAANPEATLIINANNAAKTYAVAQISDAARQAGIYQITLANAE